MIRLLYSTFYENEATLDAGGAIVGDNGISIGDGGYTDFLNNVAPTAGAILVRGGGDLIADDTGRFIGNSQPAILVSQEVNEL